MKRTMFLGGIAALLLAGCGAGLIQIPINNPMGLEGQKTTLSLRASSQAVATIPDTSATFDDQDINIPINPSGLDYTLSVRDIEFGAGCPNPLPSQIGVTIPYFKATVTDSTGSASGQVTDVKFSLTRSGSQITVSNVTGTLSFGDIGKLMSIIRKNGANTPNTATITFTDPANPSNPNLVTSSTPDLGNCSMTITWGGGRGVVKF